MEAHFNLHNKLRSNNRCHYNSNFNSSSNKHNKTNKVHKMMVLGSILEHILVVLGLLKETLDSVQIIQNGQCSRFFKMKITVEVVLKKL